MKHNTDQKLSVTLDDSVLEEVKTVKFWGFCIDNKLRWVDHIVKICARIREGIFALRNYIAILICY